MNNDRFYYAWVLFCLLVGLQVHGQSSPVQPGLPVINLTPEQGNGLINDFIRVFNTPDTLTGSEAWRRIALGLMPENSNKKKAGTGLADNGFWLVLKLRNNHPEAQAYLLELAFNRTDKVTLYEITGHKVTQAYDATGDHYNFSSRPVTYRNFVFPTDFGPYQERLLLLNLEKRLTVDRFPLRVYTQASFERHRNREFIIFGLFFGAILLIAVISAGTSFYMRMPILAYYGMYALCIGLYLLTSLGLTFQVLTPNMPELNYYNLVALVPTTMIMMIKFCQAYFNTAGNFPRLHRVYYGQIAGFLLILLIMVFWPSLFAMATVEFLYFTYLLILSVFMTTFIALHLFRQINKTNAVLFMLGYLATFLGIGYSILIDIGLVSTTVFTDSSMAVISGFFVEFGFFTAAMAVFVRKELQPPDFSRVFARVQDTDEFYLRLKGNQQVNVAEITFVQAYGHYLKFFFKDDTDVLLDRNSLKAVLAALPQQQFVQVHRSTVVNIKKVHKITSREVVLENGMSLTVTRTYYPKVKEVLQQQQG